MSDVTPATEKPPVVLRPTLEADLDAVLAIERHPENAPFIGQWQREKHEATLLRPDAEHFVMTAGEAIGGYVISYNLVEHGFGIWIQRIAVTDKSRGIGRAVLSGYLADALPRLGADDGVLDVMRTNERAQRMYRGLGFTEVSFPPDDLARLQALAGDMDDDVIVMGVRAAGLLPQDRYEVRFA